MSTVPKMISGISRRWHGAANWVRSHRYDPRLHGNKETVDHWIGSGGLIDNWFTRGVYHHPGKWAAGTATATALTQTPKLYQPSYKTDPIPPFQKKDGGTPAKTDSPSPTDDFFGWVKGSPWIATGLGLGAVGLVALTIMALRPSTQYIQQEE